MKLENYPSYLVLRTPEATRTALEYQRKHGDLSDSKAIFDLGLDGYTASVEVVHCLTAKRTPGWHSIFQTDAKGRVVDASKVKIRQEAK